MPALRSILLFGLSAASICRAHPSIIDESGLEENEFESTVVDEWQEIVNSLPGDSLKAAIEEHLRPKYREGIFSDGHNAIEAVRNNDPELATKLVDLAKHDAEIKDYLRKRQDGSNTTSITSSSSESVAPETSSSPTPVVVTTSSSSSQGQSSSSSSTPENSPSTTPSPTPTPTPTPSSSTPVESSSSSPGESTPSSSTSSVVVSSSTPIVPVDSSSTTSSTSATAPTPSSSSPESTSTTESSDSSPSSSASASPSSSLSSSEQGSQSVVPVPESSSSSVAPVSSTPPEPSTVTGVLIPVEISTTIEGGSVAVQTTRAFESTAPTSVAVPVVVTNVQGQSVTTTSMAAAVLVTNTAGSVTASPISNVIVGPGGTIIEGTSIRPQVTTTDRSGNPVVLTSPTKGGTYTVTNNRGSVVVVTYTPGGGVVSQLELKTSTLPNGSVATITQFAEVGATEAASAGGSSQSPFGTPHLQNGADRFSGSSWFAAEYAIILSVAIGFAGVLL